MEQLRETFNLIAMFLLTIANSATLSSCQNLYTFTTTIDIGSTGNVDQHTDYSWLQPLNTTISISQETTTYLPALTTVQSREILDPAETGFPNRHGKPSRRYEEEDDNLEEPADHVIPYSVHEDARDVPTRPKYVSPGFWAKPPPDKDIPLDFVPTKLHAQVRGTHTVKRLPQREAIESAETDEEKHNAHRLREVVTNSKVNTIYTEEGYEDSAYDHAGHIRDADFHEGFARKLHDQKNNKYGSRSRKKKKGKHKNLVPNEFKEYDDDYQDHLDESRKRGKISDDGHNLIEYNDAWEGSEIDPKLAVANGVRELQKDVEEDAEEAEKSEQVYQRQQESRPLSDVDSSESEKIHDGSDLKDEKDRLFMSKKEKLKSHKTTVLPAGDGRSSEVDPETPANPHGFVTNPMNAEVYSIDQTTLRYFTPASSAAFQRLDESTTINYSHLFWDYFKASQKPPTVESTTLISNSTTPNPRLEEHTSAVAATIGNHGPYLSLTKEETSTLPSTLPSTFFGTRDFHPQSLFSDHINFDPSSVGEQSRYGQNDKVNYINGVDKVIATSTVAAFSSVQPLRLLQPLQATNIENTEYSSSTTLLDDAASTPAVMTLNFTKEAYSQIEGYQANPFLSPILDNSNIAVVPNKFKYRVLVRPTLKKPIKPTVPPQPSYQQTSSSSILLQEEDDNKRIHEELNAKYNKILNYLKSKHKIKPTAGSKKIFLPEDLTLIKPPISYHRTVHPSFPTSRPIAEHSSVSVESESSREANNWRGLSRDQHRSLSTDPTYLSPFIFVHPVRLTYRKNMLPVTKLLPPSPLPLPPPIANTHVTYHSGRQHNNYLSHVPGKPQQQPRDNTLRLFPVIPNASGRSRRKRSGGDMTGEISLIVGGDDENAEEFAKKKGHVSQAKKRSKRDSGKNGANGKGHEELLNESPKVSGNVIDGEIAARFNRTEDDDETSTENKSKGKVEAEVPNFDYIEELAEDSPMEPSTTTEAHVDTKKYPFYNNKNVPVASALKYVIDPRTIPRKTSRGMEFYDSRNAYKQCDEVEADLDKSLPEKEEPDPERAGPQENLPRLRGLGNKLDCFKAKYFDENPLDNPLFVEKLVEEPKLPSELDPVKFASKVLLLPEEDDDYVVHRVSKKPERHGRQWRRRNPQYEKNKSIRVNYRHDSKTGKGRNAYLHTVRGSRWPNIAVRRMKNREPKPKNSTSTPSPKTEYETESYQNQVYEDVMGNIRNMANGYQVYEITTLPPATQIQTAGSENAPKIAEDTPNLSAEKNTTNVANVTSSNVTSAEIKGLVPPPKYSTPRRLVNYRKYRPLGKSRLSLLRAPGLPHIIAHHHAIKISKRSARAANSSADTSGKDEKKTVGKPMEVIVPNGNDTITEMTTVASVNLTLATLDLEIEESKLVLSQDQNLLSSTLKVDGKKRRRNSTSSDLKNTMIPQSNVYTIRDRIRYSKPKGDIRGFGKFSANSKTVDMDSRRKEPRYNHFKNKKSIIDPQVNSTTLSMIDSNTSAVESATSPTEGRESGTTETHHPEDSVAYQSVDNKIIAYPDVIETESVNDATSEESFEEENDEEDEVEKEEEKEEKEEEETENTTNTYHVHEDIDEDVLVTTTTLPNHLDSKEILSFQKYLETDPPGYAETFPKEMKLSNRNLESMKNKSEDSDEKQDEETDHSKNIASSWEDNSSEKAEEQIEMPMKTEKEKGDDDDASEESSSKEEESSKDDQTFFTYTTQPSWVKDDDERSEKTSSPFPFTRYKSMIKNKRNEDEDPEEKSEEVNEDYVFPWHGDKKNNKKRKLEAFDRFEYPWERRERLAKERRKRRQKRLKKLFLRDEDENENEEEEEEESRRRERPLYPWEKYNVPSKEHANTRRDISPRNMDNSEEEPSSEEFTFKKFSSKYSAANMESMIRPSSAREIGRSIRKLLEDNLDESQEEDSKEEISNEETSKEKVSKEETSKEIENYSASPTQKLSSTSQGISRRMLVPEDVTQPPRRKSGRRKTSHYDKDVTRSSRFDSKKLENKETNNEEEETKEGFMKDYLKLNNSNSEGLRSQTEATNSSQSDIAQETSSPISTPRKKRRRIIPKNNSTMSLDNVPAESSIESSTKATKKRRRKPQVSTTTSTTPLANVDLKTSKSDFAHLRKRYFMADDIVKTSTPNSTEEIPTAGAAKVDGVEAETSTPKTRTIEHRSRVSKEKIVTKTTYPNGMENFDTAGKNVTYARQEPVKKLKVKVSRRKSKRRNDANGNPNVNESPIKRKDDDIQLKKGDDESSVTSEKPKVKRDGDLLKDFGMRMEEVKKINNFSAFDGVVNDEDGNDNFGDAMPSETYAVSHMLQNISPRRRNNQVKTRSENDETRIDEKWREQISNKDDEDTAEKQKSLLQTKFIKDPERRLYYYVERK